jgi:uncharacterized protein (TIGR02453 family)
MSAESTFAGFPKDAVTFLRELAVHNEKSWFDANKSRFEESVMAPARDFVVAMGERLRSIAPDINADPRVNGSIFRINRDVRFSKDKRPYKNHVGVWFWDGPGSKMERPGFYFHLEPPKLMLGGGIHGFGKPLLTSYREAAVHPVSGPALTEVVAEVGQRFDIGEQHYKRVPTGYDADHPNAELLRFSGLTAIRQTPIPGDLYSGDLVEHCFEVFEAMLPLHVWLRELADRAAS